MTRITTERVGESRLGIRLAATGRKLNAKIRTQNQWLRLKKSRQKLREWATSTLLF